ncbi:hypothetical protein AYO44_09745 [Planctomycetaceae bacterium SCGC AG-212-F19]|nr:hypothetical protein AYO44_09745 [Planctomycetaceae bacterium SCGC AG-212-F19]
MKTTHVVLFTVLGIFASFLLCSGGLLVAVTMSHSRPYRYQSWGNNTQTPKTVAVLVATEDIAAGTRIARKEDLVAGARLLQPEALFRVRLYRIGEEPPNAITDYNQLLGKQLNRALRKGEVCLFADVHENTVHLPDGMRAMALRMNLSDTVLTALQPGMRVDLSGQVVTDGSGRMQTLADNVLVLAVTTAGEAQQVGANPPGTVVEMAHNTTITVAVTTEQAQALTLATLQGGIGLTIRRPDQ